MKTLNLLSILFAINISGQAMACPSPNFEKIFSEIKETEYISEALAVRKKYLNSMCNLNDFIKLTALENSGAIPFVAYKIRLADFILENIRPFLKSVGFQNMQLEFVRDLVPRMVEIAQELRLREMLLPTIESCNDLRLLTSPWQPSPNYDLVYLLRDLYLRESWNIWHCE